MDKKLLYRKAYRDLSNITPLKYDCGMLCNSKCCSGSSDSGMHLYPGEELLYKDTSDFLSTSCEEFGHSTVHFAVCNGTCKRKYRPLACRIYPLVPFIDTAGNLHIIEDPRAARTCPLLILREDYPINAFFKQKVRSVFHLLILDPDIRCYIEDLSDVIREYSIFTGCELPGS
ncbi:MAG TPA: hypothetical protein VHT34_04150 [Clostridia bacterium]|nr:hypothetical protein [Clostridia bacterium]